LFYLKKKLFSHFKQKKLYNKYKGNGIFREDETKNAAFSSFFLSFIVFGNLDFIILLLFSGKDIFS
jgi:hypothetical protein